MGKGTMAKFTLRKFKVAIVARTLVLIGYKRTEVHATLNVKKFQTISSSPLMGEARWGVKEKSCSPSLYPSHQGRDYFKIVYHKEARKGSYERYV